MGEKEWDMGKGTKDGKEKGREKGNGKKATMMLKNEMKSCIAKQWEQTNGEKNSKTNR